MTRDEAEQCFQLIVTIYDLHPERAADQSTVFVPMLQKHDPDVVMKVISGWVDGKGPEKFPTVGAMAQMITGIEKQREPLPQVEQYDRSVKERPRWVNVWAWARKYAGEERWFQQQNEHADESREHMSRADYLVLEDAWVKAGSPHVPFPYGADFLG